jgi:hypothetical protein
MDARRIRCLVFLVVFIASITLPAFATDISIIKAVPYIPNYSLDLRTGTGQHIAYYDMQSDILNLSGNDSYILVVSYAKDNEISEPDTFAFGLLDKIQANKNGLIIGFMLIGIMLFAVMMAKRR